MDDLLFQAGYWDYSSNDSDLSDSEFTWLLSLIYGHLVNVSSEFSLFYCLKCSQLASVGQGG